MIRVVLENMVLFLLPALVYFAYVFLTRGTSGGPGRVINEAPLLWLFLAGAALTVAILSMFSTFTGGKPGEAYEPPVMKDGHIIPGRLH